MLMLWSCTRLENILQTPLVGKGGHESGWSGLGEFYQPILDLWGIQNAYLDFVSLKCNQVFFQFFIKKKHVESGIHDTKKLSKKSNMKHKSVFSYPICSPFVFLNLFIYLLKNEFFRLECDNYISLVARIQRCGCFSKFKMLVYIRSYRLVELISPLSSFFLISQQLVG